MRIFLTSAYPQHNRWYYMLLMNLFLFSMLTSCEKEDEVPPAPLKEILLAGNTSKTWQVVEYILDGEKEPAEACEADDELTFFADKKMKLEDNSLKCNPEDPDESNGTWRLSEDGEILTMTTDWELKVSEIEELTASQMQLGLGVNYSVRLRTK